MKRKKTNKNENATEFPALQTILPRKKTHFEALCFLPLKKPVKITLFFISFRFKPKKKRIKIHQKHYNKSNKNNRWENEFNRLVSLH